MPARTASNEDRSLLGRMLANLAWLIGGKGFGAVCSLAYLAILTRSLGVRDFGHFSLIFGTAQALIAIAGFQTWRVVVRYGAEHVHRGEWNAFGRLGMISGLFDALGAVLGCVIAYFAFYHFAEELSLNPALVDLGFWFCVASLWALVSAPTGILRALDRFDLAVYIEAVVPAGRLLAAVAIWLTGPSLLRFLIAWAAIDLLEAAIYWIVARWKCPQAFRSSTLAGLGAIRGENPGLTRFFLVNYFSGSADAVLRQGPLLAVGYFVGTSAAGLFRLAHQLANGLAKLSSLLSRAAYAEILRARVAAKVEEFRKLVIQTSVLAALGSALVVILVALIGAFLLQVIGGSAFRSAHPILVALTLAASFELAAVAFEPVLHSTGRAALSLWTKLARIVIVLAALVLLVGNAQALGIAWAVAIGGLAGYLMLGSLTWWSLRNLDEEDLRQSVPT